MKLLVTAKKAATDAMAAVAAAVGIASKPKTRDGFASDEKRRAKVNADAARRRAERERLLDDLLGGDGEGGFLSRRRGWLR